MKCSDERNQRAIELTMTVADILLFLSIAISLPTYMIKQQITGSQAAAAEMASIEPENGTLAGNVIVINDPNASGGRYVVFGSASHSDPRLGSWQAVNGNGICEVGENSSNAPGDCPNPTVTAGAVNASGYGTLQAAEDAATGKALYIPAGTYSGDLTIDGPTQVIATGVTINGNLVISSTVPVTVDGLSVGGGAFINLTGSNGVTLQNCAVNRPSGQWGILVQSASNFKVLHCTVDGFNHYGILLISGPNQTAHGEVSYNEIKNATGGDNRMGIQWWGGDSACILDKPCDDHLHPERWVYDIKIIGNTVAGDANGLNQTAAIWGSLGKHISILNNYAQTCNDVCLDPEGGTDFTIQGNTIRNAKNGGITLFFGASHAQVDHNTVIQDSGWGDGFKTYSRPASDSIVIQNNSIIINAGASSDCSDGHSCGFNILWSTLKNSNITNNDIYIYNGGPALDIKSGNDQSNVFSPNNIHQ